MNNELLVSIIIPCFNQGKYLPEALQSVVAQTYGNIEIIVIDDGSTDNTQEVAKSFKNVKYIYQSNQGLSAARNTGIDNSSGDYLVFLDADDYLFPHAVAFNLEYLSENSNVAFISGRFVWTDENLRELSEKPVAIIKDHYRSLLRNNYISMHGTVMYRKYALDRFRFDSSLDFCEDYDMYLRISRVFPVLHHNEIITKYRIHNDSLSHNIPEMLRAILIVLRRQDILIENKSEKDAQLQGIRHYRKYYSTLLVENIKENLSVPTKKELELLRRHNRTLYYQTVQPKSVLSKWWLRFESTVYAALLH